MSVGVGAARACTAEGTVGAICCGWPCGAEEVDGLEDIVVGCLIYCGPDAHCCDIVQRI
jgi:hypothetical protein